MSAVVANANPATEQQPAEGSPKPDVLRGDSGLFDLSPKRTSLLVVLENGTAIDLADTNRARSALGDMSTEDLQQIIWTLRDRIAQESRAMGRRAGPRRSSGLEIGSRFGSSLALPVGGEGSEQLQEQVARLNELLTERDEQINELTAALKAQQSCPPSPLSTRSMPAESPNSLVERALMAKLQEREKMLTASDEQLSAYSNALKSRDELLQKSARLLAAERRRVADLQAAYAEQTRQLGEAEALVSTMVANGAVLPRADDSVIVPPEIERDVLMLKCALCSLMTSVDKLDAHADECEAEQRRQQEAKQMLQVRIADPQLSPNAGLLSVKVITRTDIPMFGACAFDLRRTLPDFAWLAAALAAHHPATIAPPLADDLTPATSEAALGLQVEALQRFITRVTAHPVLRKSTQVITFLSGSSQLLASMIAAPLPPCAPSVEHDPSDVEPDHLIDRTKRYLCALQDALDDVATRLDAQAAVAIDEATSERADGRAFEALAAAEPSGSMTQQIARAIGSAHQSLALAQADDIDLLVSVRSGLQSLADYAAAALDLARRLELAPAVARACVRRLQEAAASTPQLESEASEARRLADMLGDKFWEELQHFESIKARELSVLGSAHASGLASHHQQRMCKWAGVLQALAALTPAPHTQPPRRT